MQTSLARRERRRRNGNGARHRGGGAASKIAVILPLFLLSTLVLLGGVAFVGAVDAYSYYSRDLQDPKMLLEQKESSLSQQTILYDRTGKVELARFGSEHRRVLAYQDIPPLIIDATTSAEDKTFWTNSGFDPAAVLSAFRDALAGRARGASTITQQLVRQELLPPTSSTADRKIKEILQSIRLTQAYPGLQGKQTIMTDFLNLEFYGHQSYGVAAAAQGYFGVTDLGQLAPAQAAILAAMLQAPSAYDLVANAVEQDDGTLVVPADSAIAIRRNWVLDQMIQNEREGLLLGRYDVAALEAAKSEPVVLHVPPAQQMIAPQFDIQVEQQLADLLCGPGTSVDDCERVQTGGYRVTTTLDLKMQASAEKWLKAYIIAPNLGSKQAAIDYLATLGITAKSDAFDYYRIVGPNPTGTGAAGLRDRGIHNGALIAADYRTGQVLAYAGSAGFYEKAVKNPKTGKSLFDPQFDVLSNGWRQPGSSFKPITYLTGLDNKTLTAASLFMDAKTDFGGGYAPLNAAGDGTVGPMRMRDAIQFSYNIPAVKAAYIEGVPAVVNKAHDFGLTFPPGVQPGVSIGIGTAEVHPADLASAYGAIANGGALVQRTLIKSIADSKGDAIWPTATDKRAVTHPVSPQAAFVMTDMLAGNTDPKENWWWGQYEMKSNGQHRPATLKTGTSDQTEDLFAGGWVAPPADPNAPAIVTMTWAGNSDRSPGKGTMSLELTAPLWHAFMLDATAGTPIAQFAQPSGLTWKAVDAYSGMLPGPFTTKTYKEVFINGTVPTQVDNTKIPLSVDTVTNTLWVDGCPGVQATKGYLDLSKVDAGNSLFQKYDAIWIAQAKAGHQSSFQKRGWGAPWPPSATCTPGPAPTPSPSDGATPGPSASVGPSPTKTPSPQPTRTPRPNRTPPPPAP